MCAGSRRQGGSILAQLDASWELQQELDVKTKELKDIDNKLQVMQVFIVSSTLAKHVFKIIDVKGIIQLPRISNI